MVKRLLGTGLAMLILLGLLPTAQAADGGGDVEIVKVLERENDVLIQCTSALDQPQDADLYGVFYQGSKLVHIQRIALQLKPTERWAAMDKPSEDWDWAKFLLLRRGGDLTPLCPAYVWEPFRGGGLYVEKTQGDVHERHVVKVKLVSPEGRRSVYRVHSYVLAEGLPEILITEDNAEEAVRWLDRQACRYAFVDGGDAIKIWLTSEGEEADALVEAAAAQVEQIPELRVKVWMDDGCLATYYVGYYTLPGSRDKREPTPQDVYDLAAALAGRFCLYQVTADDELALTILAEGEGPGQLLVTGDPKNSHLSQDWFRWDPTESRVSYGPERKTKRVDEDTVFWMIDVDETDGHMDTFRIYQRGNAPALVSADIGGVTAPGDGLASILVLDPGDRERADAVVTFRCKKRDYLYLYAPDESDGARYRTVWNGQPVTVTLEDELEPLPPGLYDVEPGRVDGTVELRSKTRQTCGGTITSLTQGGFALEDAGGRTRRLTIHPGTRILQIADGTITEVPGVSVGDEIAAVYRGEDWAEQIFILAGPILRVRGGRI